MHRHDKKEQGLRSTAILMDIRNAVINVKAADGKPVTPVTLSEYYRRISDGYHHIRLSDETSRDIRGDRAAERVQDMVRQLAESRKNSKASSQIKAWKTALTIAIHDTLRFGGSEVLSDGGVERAVDAIDNAILTSITKRKLQLIANKSAGASI